MSLLLLKLVGSRFRRLLYVEEKLLLVLLTYARLLLNRVLLRNRALLRRFACRPFLLFAMKKVV